MNDIIEALFRDEAGATMVEYALIIAVIAIVAVIGARALGAAVNTNLNSDATTVSGS